MCETRVGYYIYKRNIQVNTAKKEVSITGLENKVETVSKKVNQKLKTKNKNKRVP